MYAVENAEPVSFSSFGEEMRFYWRKLPDRFVFAGLLAAWVLLFYVFGWTSAIVGRSDSLFSWMWEKWTDPSNDSSHGKLIPFAVAGLLWLRRKRLVAAAGRPWWPALIGIAVALVLHMAAYLIQQPRISMFALFAGGWMLTGLVWGPRMLKATFFPFFIFGFCVPMGGTFAQGLTLPLRVMAAKGATFIGKDLLDVPVNRVGTKLLGQYGSFDVAAECSGIRSFVALLAITTIFSVLTMRTWWKQAVIILATVPLALICNIFRITTVILATNAFQTQTAGRFVDSYFGYVTYAVAIGGVFLLARLLRDKPAVKAVPNRVSAVAA